MLLPSQYAAQSLGNNKNRALTGFWIESSLLVSPKEQTEIMERIFGKESVYKEETREELKRVMLAVGHGSIVHSKKFLRSIYAQNNPGR